MDELNIDESIREHSKWVDMVGGDPEGFIRWVNEVRAAAWDEAIDEAEGCGWIHDYAVTEMHARNPYKEQQ